MIDPQAGAIKSIQQLGDNTGSVLMVLVAFLWYVPPECHVVG